MKENEASSTALSVAQGILYTAQNKRYIGLVSDELRDCTQRILKASDAGRKRLKQLDSWLFRKMVPVAESILMPAITLHYVLRKRGIEDYALKALSEGITQVVNLGAGFDTLLYRLSQKYPKVNFIEIDHPATQKLKQQFFAESGEAHDNLHCLPIDFTHQTLEHELAHCADYKADQPTLFISEGVLMYLSETEVSHVFEVLKKLSQSRLRFVFTALEPENNTHNSLLKRYLQKMGESINWFKPKAELAAFIAQQGYVFEGLDTEPDLSLRYIKGPQPTVLHQHEYLVYTHAE
ncbi:MAG: class I SAM-dependent methyltransferase [Gammaproteobacteria bacterium]